MRKISLLDSVVVKLVEVVVEIVFVGVVKINDGVQVRISSFVHFTAHGSTLSAQKISDFISEILNTSFCR